MAKCFTEWTVLPHDPIEKIAENLWRVVGWMNEGKVQRQMVLGRMADGRVIVHNGIALEEPQMKEIEAWGKPSVLFVPNAFHRQDSYIWKKRYPEITVVAPSGARKAVSKIVGVDAVIEDAPGDEQARLRPFAGAPGAGVLEVRAGGETSLVFCDTVMNLDKTGGFIGFLLSPTGKVAVPRVTRMMLMKDRKAFKKQLTDYADDRAVKRLLCSHGKPVTGDVAGALRQCVQQLGG
jgi:hypothetical protein